MSHKQEELLEKKLEIAIAALNDIWNLTLPSCRNPAMTMALAIALDDIKKLDYEPPVVLTWYEIKNGETVEVTSDKGNYPKGARFRYINNLFTRIDNADPPIERE